MAKNTVDYYRKNAQSFFNRTIDTDLSPLTELFLSHLPENAHILDAGCGSGRDSKTFLSLGHQITAFDASPEMSKLASEEINHPVLTQTFEEISYKNEFDAIWASASLLHIPYIDLPRIFEKFHAALNPSGILYASFKYGNAKRQAGDRTFYDMNEENILPFLTHFAPIEIWQAADTRSTVAASPAKAWLHLICQVKPHLSTNYLI